MRKRLNTSTWIIIILFIIGIAQMLKDRPSTILVPLIVFGLIYYFYRNPDKLNFTRKRYTNQSSENRSKQKDYPFKVIKGNKDDYNDKPKYH